MEKKLLELLHENARLSVKELSERIGCSVAEVKKHISEMETKGIIRGYTIILNDEEIDDQTVKALIEVKVAPSREGGFDKVAKRISKYPEVSDLCLVSGSFDLLITINGRSLKEVAEFVASKLATIDGVMSTSTGFLLKKYKEAGRVMDNEEEYERLKICP